jgi:hypothetical protein
MIACKGAASDFSLKGETAIITGGAVRITGHNMVVAAVILSNKKSIYGGNYAADIKQS